MHVGVDLSGARWLMGRMNSLLRRAQMDRKSVARRAGAQA